MCKLSEHRPVREMIPQSFRMHVRRALISAVILVLAATVAQRYTDSGNLNLYPVRVTISAHTSAKANQQRMEQDSFVWSPSLAPGVSVPSPTYYPRYAPAGPLDPKHIYDSQLYNRPPPVLSFS